MKEKAIFYHAGCPVCIGAEQTVAAAIDADRYELEVVHLGENKGQLLPNLSPGQQFSRRKRLRSESLQKILFRPAQQ